ncbi:uncharacterized protein LOC110749049 isoform X3 [Prunus avium]|uniref:Uncharacterized protein LOC110749049 isoform X3 n=1 Tax=Prunus avium TaxID=42229 RepID=A0A6P5RP87_PRUAV|nr:uncharacterized protein LOC110749049 isoform X3 [Prunus avium]
MATPMLLMASEQSTTQDPTKTLVGFYEESKPESTKSTKGTKRSGKASNSKKQPQRGLGVAQLERLRLQDRWKKMTELPQLQPQPQVVNLPDHHQYQNFQHQNPTRTLPGPLASVPVQYGASSYNGPLLIKGSGGNGLFGFVGQRVGNGHGFGYVGGNNLVVDLNPSPYAIGAPDPRFEVGAVFETSKELSSIPKQKKRLNSRNYMGLNGRSGKSAACIPINSSGFLRLNPEAGGGQVVGTHSGYRNDDQGVEVRAVHRKGSSAGGGIFMEYDFFPAAGGKSSEMRGGTCPKEPEMWQTAEASVSVGSHEEPSDITASSYGYGIGADSYHNPVDLSLKLSF